MGQIEDDLLKNAKDLMAVCEAWQEYFPAPTDKQKEFLKQVTDAAVKIESIAELLSGEVTA